MDLSTNYLGIRLPHPLVPGASPLSDDLDTVKRLEDAGAAAIVLRSLFEEQITREQEATHNHWDSHDDAFAEAVTFFPSPDSFVLGPDEYLNHVQRVKQTARIPVIGSLNGMTPGGWLSYARLIEQAGADALELNVYHAPTDFDERKRGRAPDHRDGSRSETWIENSGGCETFAVLHRLRPLRAPA